MSTAFLYARLYGDRDTGSDGQYIYMRPPKVIEKLGLLPGRDHLEVEEGIVWAANLSVGMGGRAGQFVGGTAVGDRRILVWSYSSKGESVSVGSGPTFSRERTHIEGRKAGSHIAAESLDWSTDRRPR